MEKVWPAARGRRAPGARAFGPERGRIGTAIELGVDEARRCPHCASLGRADSRPGSRRRWRRGRRSSCGEHISAAARSDSDGANGSGRDLAWEPKRAGDRKARRRGGKAKKRGLTMLARRQRDDGPLCAQGRWRSRLLSTRWSRRTPCWSPTVARATHLPRSAHRSMGERVSPPLEGLPGPRRGIATRLDNYERRPRPRRQ